MTQLTQARLRQLLHYDPKTGVFTRLMDTGGGRFKAGTVAGCSNGRYREIWIDGERYSEHRIAWMWMMGSFPREQIDHKNLNKKDNRWTNLREATISQNAMNRPTRARSGAKGVNFIVNGKKAGRKRWRAVITEGGKIHRLGTFLTREEAKAAYDAAAARLHGEFARVA
jgi:Demerecviridae HNH endonuclease